MNVEKTLSELRVMSAEEWSNLSKSDQENLKKSKPYKQMQAEFKASMEASPAAVVGVAKIFERVFSESRALWKNADDTTIPAVDEAALLAFFQHLKQALYDPDIQKSTNVFNVVSDVLVSLGELNFGNVLGAEVAAALGRPARSDTNKKNAKKSRLPQKKDAAELFNKWLLDPSAYKNKAAFKRDIVDSQLCKDVGTAASWLSEFIRENSPASDWLKPSKKSG